MQQIIVNTVQETECLAKKIGSLLQSGDVLVLSGELGSGKTTFTKGLAQGLGITQMVKSPTYTLVREYHSGRLPLYHMDVYRVDGEVTELGLEEYFEGDGVSVVEWGNLLEKELPEDYITLEFQRISGSDEQRRVTFRAVGVRSTELLKSINEEVK